jgi:hypothetical protein
MNCSNILEKRSRSISFFGEGPSVSATYEAASMEANMASTQRESALPLE